MCANAVKHLLVSVIGCKIAPMPEQIGTLAVNYFHPYTFEVLFWLNGIESPRICRVEGVERLQTVMRSLGCPLDQNQIKSAEAGRNLSGFGLRSV
jgi:hypothetical protein